MSNIVYVNDDLFNAPKGSILAHACNCQGVWGSGVAKQFAERFPESYEDYKIVCKVLKKETIPGLACVLKYENGHIVIALFTSENYGEKVDAPDVILRNTQNCFDDLMNHSVIREIHMPKINSGLFKVPWEQTETVLKQFPEITFYVYSK